jgi:urea transporter
MAALSSLATGARRFVEAWLRGCAQIAFCDSPLTGLLVLAGIALIVPLAGVGTLLGALFGTLAGRLTSAYPREEWVWGLAGFNPGIVGLMWGGFFAEGDARLALLAVVMGMSVALDLGFRRLTARYRLPALSLGALATLYLTSFLAAPSGAWFWVDAPASNFLPYGLLGAALVALATLIKSPFAAIWALLLAGVAAVSSFLCGQDPLALVGLWGMTVPLASFGVHAVFLRGSLVGCAAGTLAALIGALIWIVWQATPLADWLPPLLLPFILGVWLAMVLVRVVVALPAAQPGRWRVARMIANAHREGRDVVAIVQGVSDAPVSSFVSGAWLDPNTPRGAFEAERLHRSPRLRQAFWDVADRLRTQASKLGIGSLWPCIARLQGGGWIDTVIVQDVLLPPDLVSSRAVLPLHGSPDCARCLDCGQESPWPPKALWRRCDLRCTACHGPVSPGLTLFGEALDPAVATRLEELAKRCALVLVLGDDAPEAATLAFLERVRDAGAAVAFVSEREAGYPRRPGDCSLVAPAEPFLAFLERSLKVIQFFARGVWPRIRRVHKPMTAAKQGGGAGA